MNLTNLQSQSTFLLSRGGLVLKKHSPEILLGIGLAGFVATIFLAAQATLKVDEVLEKPKDDLQKIEDAKAELNTSDYTEEDILKDKAIVYTKASIELLKLYGPALAVGTLSVSAILASHGVMKNRQVALISAFNIVNEGWKQYRQRVIKDQGQEADDNYRFGVTEEEIVELTKNEDGKVLKVKKNVKRYDRDGLSRYAFVFDSECPAWKPNAEFNVFYLESQEIYANRLLQTRGHVTLNDIHDALGVPRTSAGQLVGWVKGHGDDRVDFRIKDMLNFNQAVINNDPRLSGRPEGILLDPNVDGVVYDIIDELNFGNKKLGLWK